MGNKTPVNKEIKTINKEKENEEVRIAIYGSFQVGKSTLFKQIRNIYGNHYSKEELLTFRDFIYENIIFCLKVYVFCLLYPPGEHQEPFSIAKKLNEILEKNKDYEKSFELIFFENYETIIYVVNRFSFKAILNSIRNKFYTQQKNFLYINDNIE